MTSYRIVYGENTKAAAWCLREGWQLGSTAQGIGLERNGELVALCTFDDYRGSDIRIHAAKEIAQRFIPREYLHAVYAYPFIQLGCLRVTAPIVASNVEAIALVQRAGFVYETKLARAARGDDLMIYVLWRESCRFLAPKWKEKRNAVSMAD